MANARDSGRAPTDPPRGADAAPAADDRGADAPDAQEAPGGRAETPPSPEGRSRRRVLIGAGIALVVVVLAIGWIVFSAESVRQTSEDEARRRLDDSSAPTAGTAPVPDAAPLTAVPAQGVYRYRGTGREETSFPPLTEEQGPAMPATVTAQADGCWLFRIDYNTHHWQEWSYCTAGGKLTDHGGSTFSRRTIGGVDIDNTSTFTCDPPVIVLDRTAETGTARSRSCSGAGSFVADPTTVSGTTTQVGRETITVDGTDIDTIHQRDELTYSGAQSGTESSDTWFDAATGLPVRNEHHIVVVTGTPLGDITYTEDGSFELETPGPV